jgi:tetratricopeptide (TPR) repeat protein
MPDRRVFEGAMRELVSRLGGEAGELTASDRAQEVIYEAFEASGAERVRLARRALEISADCADAYVLLAEHASSPDEARKLYEQGVAAGERALGKQAFAEHAGRFWGVLETRPYMRAREGLALSLWEAGQKQEAAGHYRELLRLNPDDNQGARYCLATLLLDLDREDELQRLLADYDDEASAVWAYSKTLLAFRKRGDCPEASQLLAKARKVNKHVPAYLLGHKQLPHEQPPYISPGGDDEAVSYAVSNRRAWLNTPGAVSWLRKTLDARLPEPPERRRPSWPQLKLALSRLPRQDDDWEVDVIPSMVAASARASEGDWTVVVASQANYEPVSIESFHSQPRPDDVWNCLVDAMRKPRDAEPCRPAVVVVRDKALQAAWKTKLKQIDVQCVVNDALEVIDAMISHVSRLAGEREARGPAAATAEELLQLPTEPDDIWQADLRATPNWITGEGQPYRPWMAMVISRTNDLVLAHQLSRDRPPVSLLWEAVLEAAARPAMGQPHRPGRIEVATVDQRQFLLPHLNRAGIECVALERLERLDSVWQDMTKHLVGEDELPSLLDVPGMEPARVGGFYAAAAEFYRRRPWQQVPGDTPIKVECDKFQSGPWYAVVMGQSGVQQGVAVYEDLAALQGMIGGSRSEEENLRRMSALSLMYSEAFEMPVGDLDAAEKFGWPVAGPEAYPLVIKINPGMARRPPLTWELELMEASLRTIPDFVAEKKAVLEKTVATASGRLAVRLSRS